jgi:hypothetical protein
MFPPVGPAAAAAERLLAEGASPWSQDCNRRLPLHFAAEAGHAACVRLLVAAMRRSPAPAPLEAAPARDGGASPPAGPLEVLDQNGQTPVQLAAEHGHPDCVALLLDADGTGAPPPPAASYRAALPQLPPHTEQHATWPVCAACGPVPAGARPGQAYPFAVSSIRPARPAPSPPHHSHPTHNQHPPPSFAQRRPSGAPRCTWLLLRVAWSWRGRYWRQHGRQCRPRTPTAGCPSTAPPPRGTPTSWRRCWRRGATWRILRPTATRRCTRRRWGATSRWCACSRGERSWTSATPPAPPPCTTRPRRATWR